ncbi:uncharacterized mitochondrial protein AtMg00810-like [Phragmites australis]|uniref:uncharacterized mitochondrial protein AtMg00810-like n=1 Tax=Phragmites australis TaxID=29695 RepID=UPI002D765E0D|nr:uncharacterized mitochondrial protein AtMg00810-like [Phragmites australis]
MDDLIITRLAKEEINRFKAEMKTQFKMSDLGLLSFYIRIKVQQSNNGNDITLCQAHYTTQILKMTGMRDCNPAHTQMEERLKLSHNMTAEMDATEYRRLVGSLCYLVHTRPDPAFCVEFVSRFMERPTQEHMTAVKRILRYVAGTINYGCHYRKAEEGRLVGYT